jgi:hypothetical protein
MGCEQTHTVNRAERLMVKGKEFTAETRKIGRGRWKRDDGRKENKQDQNRERIDKETFHRLDDCYEHIFAILNAMEKKADTFCPPSS